MIKITWDQFYIDTLKVAEKIGEKKFSKIIAIARGGLLPATILSHALGISDIESIQIKSYTNDKEQHTIEDIGLIECYDSDILIVDDLVDTGDTFMYLKLYYPNATYAAVYSKPCAFIAEIAHYSIMAPDDWLAFPYEKD